MTQVIQKAMVMVVMVTMMMTMTITEMVVREVKMRV